MPELLQLAISPANLPYTILLGLMVVYWLTVFIGALDLDFLDVDLDVDADAEVDVDLDVDADAEVDADSEVSGGGGWFLSTASFFNLGAVPFMIFMSFLALTLWIGSILTNYYLGDRSEWMPLMIALPNLLVALFATKLLTSPFKAIHKTLVKTGTKKRELVGKTCRITLDVRPGKLGQADLQVGDRHFLLNVRTTGEETIPRGQQAILVEYNPKTDQFMVMPFDV